MFRPLEELIHAYFARIWPIATCENQHPAFKDPSASVSDELRQYPVWGTLFLNVRASSSAKCRHPRTADSTSRINCSPLTAPPLRFEYHNILIKLMIQHILPTSDSDNKLVSLSGMAETPRPQTKQVLRCRQATCHSGHRAGIQEIRFLDFWMPDRVRHDKNS